VTSHEETKVRRTPKQDRGARRIAKILDAAAAVFDEVGYEAATTVTIAARAQTAVGSLYQFFPNKDAIVQGLLERYSVQLHAVFEAIVTPDLVTLPLPTVLDHVLDPLMEFELGQSGFKALFMGIPASSPVVAATQALTDEVARRLATIIHSRVPQIDPVKARRHSLVCVQIVKSFLALTPADASFSRDEALTEMKAVLLAYLRPIVGR